MLPNICKKFECHMFENIEYKCYCERCLEQHIGDLENNFNNQKEVQNVQK